MVEDGSVELILTPAILDEIERVLSYPKIAKALKKSGLSVDDVLSYLMEGATIVEDGDTIRVVADDPSDDKFIEAAWLSGAKWLLSRDNHLLKIGSYGNIAIVTPGEFFKRNKA